MSAKEKNGEVMPIGITVGPMFVIGTFVLGGIMIRTGYSIGLNTANRILKRHDKDVRKMDRRTKKYFKQMEKREEKIVKKMKEGSL